MGIWVRSGSRFEQPSLNGICHFIEHMLFKGTERRSTYDIAREIDSVGGALNAFTSKEFTSFYCRVLLDNMELAADLLTDIFLKSSFPEEEIEREKLVVCQEISQLEDSPEELVHELLGMRFWRNDPLGQPILGTVSSIENLDRETLIAFKRDNYRPEDTVVAAVGNLDHDGFVELIASQMGALRGAPSLYTASPVATEPSIHAEVKDLEQTHICIGGLGPSAINNRRHAGCILNAILGGGMSSRLFQEIREKRGLAYSVYTYLSCFSDTGLFGIYAACEPGRLEELLSVTAYETMRLPSTITEDEVRTAKNQLRGCIVLSMESGETRMNRLAKGEFYFGRYISLNEILEPVEAVTRDGLIDEAREMIDENPFAVVALGPIEDDLDLSAYFKTNRDKL